MNVKSVNNNLPFFNNVENKKKETKSTEQNSDKLEISKEALKIKDSSGDLNKLDAVKSKIQSKFYDSDEVINTVAEKILKDF
jgi:hypothetical protein